MLKSCVRAIFLAGVLVSPFVTLVAADAPAKVIDPAPNAEQAVMAFVKACEEQDEAAVKRLIYPAEGYTPKKLDAMAQKAIADFSRQQPKVSPHASAARDDLACVMLANTSGRQQVFGPTFLKKRKGEYRLIIGKPKEFQAQIKAFDPWVLARYQARERAAAAADDQR